MRFRRIFRTTRICWQEARSASISVRIRWCSAGRWSILRWILQKLAYSFQQSKHNVFSWALEFRLRLWDSSLFPFPNRWQGYHWDHCWTFLQKCRFYYRERLNFDPIESRMLSPRIFFISIIEFLSFQFRGEESNRWKKRHWVAYTCYGILRWWRINFQR